MAKRVSYIWMKVTKDDLELPVCVAGSVKELSEMSGSSVRTIYARIWEYENRGRKGGYLRIPADEEEENDDR